MTRIKPRLSGPEGLLIVPVLIPLVTGTLIWFFGPYEGDPSYGPLMSALNLLHFHPPGYLDHPGTPIHILGAFVLALGWLVRLPFTGFAGLDTDILRDPNMFLVYINIVIALLIGCANYFLGRRLWEATGSIGAALAGQATIFMAYPYLLTLPLVTPDSLLIATTTLFVALLVPLVFTPGFTPDRRYAGIMGAVFGVTIATKITCLPLGLLLFLLPGRSLRLIALRWIVAAFFLSILPGIRLLPGVVSYYFAILTHTGVAGTGSKGAPSLSLLAANFQSILAPGQGLLVALALCCLLLLGWPRLRAYSPPGLRKVLLLSALIIVIQFILVTKNPGDRYLEPAYAVTALLYPALFLVASQAVPSRAAIFQAGIATLMILVATGAVNTTWAWLWNAHVANSDNEQLLARVTKSGCDMVPYYNAPAKEYRLIFGNGTAAGRHSQSLARLYPDFLSFHNGRLRFETFEKVLTPAEAMTLLRKKRCIYLVGSGMERMQPFGIAAAMMEPVERTHHGRVYSTAVFRLKMSPGTTWADLGLPPAADNEK